MNPVFITSILNSKPVRNISTAIIVIVVVFVVYKFGQSAINKMRENTRKENLDNLNNAYAARIYNLFFPFGELWAWWVNTDEDKVIEIAEQIGKKRIDEVAKAYRLSYNRVLIDDIRKFLDDEEQERFFKAIAA
ncbi:hypothetical protein [Chondrinema litorale]|uniref:hypothetical protein n=1 Tax=Chondrinema litorale TaxID=2994555 RepID=UPI000C61796E|nr:hypothetical protein [Chondrinema litorale]MBT29831.1 hypothetical protein [Thalassovita sp.]UZR95328.1 hypothetical protein OQ292_05775 [Chondrinema litorale]